MSNPNQVAGGHKANLNNPNTSDEAKENSKQALENIESGDSADSGAVDAPVVTGDKDSQKNENNVIGGHKATLNNPRVGEEAKEHSKQVLQEHGVDV